jgi:hypothetical protein
MLRLVADQLKQRGLGRVFGAGDLHLLLGGGGAEVERRQDILSLHDQAGIIADQLVRAGALGAEDLHGHGEDIAALLERIAHGDQRQAADHPVAHREQLRDRARADRELGRILTAPHGTCLAGGSHWTIAILSEL